MSIEWRYVKQLINANLIEDFECAAVYIFSDTFKKCVLKNNGGRPSISLFNTNKAKEREIKSLLSFNKTDKENIWTMNEWVKCDFNNKLIAFAIDNFGNLICFNTNNDNIVFWNHENNETEFIAKNFDDFIAGLYD